MHSRPSLAQALPSLGTIAGQPGVAGGPEHCHFGGGAMHGPPKHELHWQIVAAPTTQTSPSWPHTPLGGSVKAQWSAGGERHTDLVVTQSPLLQSHSLRHSGRTSSP
jgi:hypothetical protein